MRIIFRCGGEAIFGDLLESYRTLAHYTALLPAPLHEVQQRWSLHERWAAVRTTLTGLNPRQTRSPSILGVQSTLLTALPHTRAPARAVRAELRTAFSQRVQPSSSEQRSEEDGPAAPRGRSPRRGPGPGLGPARGCRLAPPAPLAHRRAVGRRAAADAAPGPWKKGRRAPGPRVAFHNYKIRAATAFAGHCVRCKPTRADGEKWSGAARVSTKSDLLSA